MAINLDLIKELITAIKSNSVSAEQLAAAEAHIAEVKAEADATAAKDVAQDAAIAANTADIASDEAAVKALHDGLVASPATPAA